MPHVKLLGGLGRKFGTAFDSDARNIAELLTELAQRGGPALAARLFRDGDEAGRGELHRDLRVLVNGRSVVFLAGIDTETTPGDVVTLHESGMRGYPGG